jgi:hypothetical protein
MLVEQDPRLSFWRPFSRVSAVELPCVPELLVSIARRLVPMLGHRSVVQDLQQFSASSLAT